MSLALSVLLSGISAYLPMLVVPPLLRCGGTCGLVPHYSVAHLFHNKTLGNSIWCGCLAHATGKGELTGPVHRWFVTFLITHSRGKVNWK